MRNAMGGADDGSIIGTSAYYTPRTAPDPVIQPEQESYPQAGLGDQETNGVAWTSRLQRPRPDTGGFIEAFGRLGFSRGLGAFRMATRMRGQTMERESIGVHSADDGPVGFGTRSTNRPRYLFVDFTPNDEEIAQSAMEGWR